MTVKTGLGFDSATGGEGKETRLKRNGGKGEGKDKDNRRKGKKKSCDL